MHCHVFLITKYVQVVQLQQFVVSNVCDVTGIAPTRGRSRRDGPALYARQEYLSTKAWTPSMGSRRAAPAASRRWASSSTTAVIAYQPCSSRQEHVSLSNLASTPRGCSSRYVKFDNIRFIGITASPQNTVLADIDSPSQALYKQRRLMRQTTQ